MKLFIASSLFFCFALLSCSTNKTASEDVKADSVSQPAQATEAKDDSTRTLVLQWKSVSSSEWGPSYEFTDESGNDFTAHQLAMPGFSEENNEYFTSTPVDGSPFSRYEIKDAIKQNWYDVKVYTKQEENENAGEGEMKDVQIIVSLKPH
jgi:hypothetical protein